MNQGDGEEEVVDVKIAIKLRLKLTKSPSYVKTVNANPHDVVVLAYGVSI